MKNVISLGEMDPARFNDGYPQLLGSIKSTFDTAVYNTNEPLFLTDAFGLYDLFLANLPSEARQHYNCRACRNFVERYGGLVCIDKHTGDLHPVMWSDKKREIPPFFGAAVSAIRKRVLDATVVGIFVPSKMNLGVERTGSWEHMHVSIPAHAVYYNPLKTAEQKFAENNEDFRCLFDYVKKYSRNSRQYVQTAINYLGTGVLYRGDRFTPQATWFLDILNDLLKTRKWRNIVWWRTATAPTGWCHIGNSVLGALIDDIAAGYSFEDIKARFESKMDPAQYQRPQAAPAEGNIARAESIVAKLGIENSLKRRFARLDEIRKIWTPKGNVSRPESGVFRDVQPKQKKRQVDSCTGGIVTMTWEKFRRKVLPEALKIEYLVGCERHPFGAIVTAQYHAAPPIIKWDTERNRNPFSWYVYRGGSFPESWNLPRNAYVEVDGITLQPNLWNDEFDLYGCGTSVIFILHGAKDTGYKGSGSALFPELLKSDLREVRSTIEAFSKKTDLDGYDSASACGLRLEGNNSRTWNNEIFRVTTQYGTTLYKLDRWD